MISIHAPREGRDHGFSLLSSHSSPFQSTRPVRGATDQQLAPRPQQRDISIHAPREGRDHDVQERQALTLRISIHAPREGRDRVDG